MFYYKDEFAKTMNTPTDNTHDHHREYIRRQEEHSVRVGPSADALEFIMTLPENTKVNLRDDWADWIIGGVTTKPAIRYLKTFYPNGQTILRVYRWDDGSYDVHI